MVTKLYFTPSNHSHRNESTYNCAFFVGLQSKHAWPLHFFCTVLIYLGAKRRQIVPYLNIEWRSHGVGTYGIEGYWITFYVFVLLIF